MKIPFKNRANQVMKKERWETASIRVACDDGLIATQWVVVVVWGHPWWPPFLRPLPTQQISTSAVGLGPLLTGGPRPPARADFAPGPQPPK